ncbi:hypothetical protein CRG98_045827, partial [Punica granatum]
MAMASPSPDEDVPRVQIGPEWEVLEALHQGLCPSKSCGRQAVEQRNRERQ